MKGIIITQTIITVITEIVVIIYFVPGTVLSVLHRSSHLISNIAFDYSHVKGIKNRDLVWVSNL